MRPFYCGNLSERVPFDKTSHEYEDLKAKFGDQIQFNEEKKEVQWRSDMFADMFDPGKKFTIRLGRSTDALIKNPPNDSSRVNLRQTSHHQRTVT